MDRRLARQGRHDQPPGLRTVRQGTAFALPPVAGRAVFTVEGSAAPGAGGVDRTRRDSAAPGFDRQHWPSMSDRTWASGVHRFYGLPYGAQ